MKPKKKYGNAPWVSAFPAQHKKLHPETSKAGGIKSRSTSEAVRMAIYRPIAELFKAAHPRCQACEIIFKYIAASNTASILGWPFVPNPTEHVHHTRGREGLLLFDIRYWKAVCAECHEFIGSNIEMARRLKLICDKGDWNKQPKE